MKKSLISLLLIFSLLVGLLFCISSCKKDTGINKTQPQGDCNYFSISWEDYDIENSISGYIIDLYMINDNFAAIKFWTDGKSTKSRQKSASSSLTFRTLVFTIENCTAINKQSTLARTKY